MSPQHSDTLLTEMMRQHMDGISPHALVDELVSKGHSPKEARLVIQRALDKGAVTLDKQFFVRLETRLQRPKAYGKIYI